MHKQMYRKRTPVAVKPKVKIERRVDERYWWDREYHRFLTQAYGEARHGILDVELDLTLFALATGLRVSEIASCDKSHCDPAGKVRVPVSKSGAHITLVEPRHLEWYREFLSESIPGLLFPFSIRTLQRYWDRTCLWAHVRSLGGIHGARHTYATWAVASGWLKLEQLSRCLGHSSYAITADFYVGSTIVEEKMLNGKPPHWWGAAMKPATNVIPLRAVGGV